MAAAGAVAAPARAASVLWRFSRPHTVIGTAVSVTGLFAICVSSLEGVDAGRAAFHLFWVLVAGLAFVPIGAALALRARLARR